MRFTLLLRGEIAPPSGATKASWDESLQTQLGALYSVTGTTYNEVNKRMVGDTVYTAILPGAFLCSLEIRSLLAARAVLRESDPHLPDIAEAVISALAVPQPSQPVPPATPAQTRYTVALDRRQFCDVSISADRHWCIEDGEHLHIVRVTAWTGIDDAVLLGGPSILSHRRDVF